MQGAQMGRGQVGQTSTKTNINGRTLKLQASALVSCVEADQIDIE